MTPTLTPCTETPGKMDYVPATGWRFCVTFDVADATYFVSEEHKLDSLVPLKILHGHALRYELPENTDASMFEKWVTEEAQPFLKRIRAGYTTALEEGKEVAFYSDDAVSVAEMLDYLFDHGHSSMAAIPRLTDRQFASVNRGCLYNGWHELAGDHGISGITAETDDGQILGIADKVNADALNQGLEIDNTIEYLTGIRDSLRENVMYRVNKIN